MKAKVAYTYGWTDTYISNMAFKTFIEYWKSITMIESQKAILDIQIASYPHMKKSSRDKKYKEFKKLAYSGIDQSDGKTYSVQELASKLAGKLNG